MSNFLTSILASLIAGFVGFVSGFFFSKVLSFIRYRHLERLIPKDRRVLLVIPSARVRVFEVKGSGEKAEFPSNVECMPQPEGEAIGKLVSCLRGLSRIVEVTIINEDNANINLDYGLFLSIGGPSVNKFSHELLSGFFPKFTLQYPEHEAFYESEKYGMNRYIPERNKENQLKEDFGFTFVYRNVEEKKVFIVLCGVWGTGTLAAVRGLINLPPSSDATRYLATCKRLFLVFKTIINGFETNPPQQYFIDPE